MTDNAPKHWAELWEEFKARHPELAFPGVMPMPTQEAPPMPPQAPEAHEREPGEDDDDSGV